MPLHCRLTTQEPLSRTLLDDPVATLSLGLIICTPLSQDLIPLSWTLLHPLLLDCLILLDVCPPSAQEPACGQARCLLWGKEYVGASWLVLLSACLSGSRGGNQHLVDRSASEEKPESVHS